MYIYTTANYKIDLFSFVPRIIYIFMSRESQVYTFHIAAHVFRFPCEILNYFKNSSRFISFSCP